MNQQHKPIFVFGSNEAGIHGAGAAHAALLHYGAIYGIGFGPQGSSFAIPTKDWQIQTLDYDVVKNYVERFIAYARKHRSTNFQVTRIGCGLAGFQDQDMASLFKYAPDNCWFDEFWKPWLPHHLSWGKF